MARRYVNPNRPVLSAVWDSMADLGRSQQIRDVMELARRDPELAAQLRREFMGGRIRALAGGLPAAVDGDAPEPVSAKLDSHGWAASWGSFLNAIGDKSDRLGARAAIGKVMDSPEFRPVSALGERVPSEGGYLVPWRLTEQVLAYLTTAIIWPRATPVPMDSLWQALPMLENTSQASGAQGLGGMTFAMTAEAASIPASTPKFGEIQLEARKFAGLLSGVPNELVDDSPAFNDFCARVIGLGYAWFLDDLAFSGDGVHGPEGILNSPAAVSVTRVPPDGFDVGHADVVSMVKQLHPASKTRACWLIGNDLFGELLELYEVVATAPAGQDVPPPQSLRFNSVTRQWELLGLPAFATDHQPAAGDAGDLVLADLGLYLAGTRHELLVERSAQGPGFISDTSSYRIKARVDGRYWPQQPYVLANGTTVSPLVILGTS